MKVKIVALVAPFAFFTAATAWAAAPDDKTDLVDVQSATCAQFAQAMVYAKPPANPTPKQAEFAALAQDALILAMTWVNGYLAGRDGAKGAQAFTQDWIVTYMGKMAAVCKANTGSMRLVDAAAKL